MYELPTVRVENAHISSLLLHILSLWTGQMLPLRLTA